MGRARVCSARRCSPSFRWLPEKHTWITARSAARRSSSRRRAIGRTTSPTRSVVPVETCWTHEGLLLVYCTIIDISLRGDWEEVINRSVALDADSGPSWARSPTSSSGGSTTRSSPMRTLPSANFFMSQQRTLCLLKTLSLVRAIHVQFCSHIDNWVL